MNKHNHISFWVMKCGLLIGDPFSNLGHNLFHIGFKIQREKNSCNYITSNIIFFKSSFSLPYCLSLSLYFFAGILQLFLLTVPTTLFLKLLICLRSFDFGIDEFVLLCLDVSYQCMFILFHSVFSLTCTFSLENFDSYCSHQ